MFWRPSDNRIVTRRSFWDNAWDGRDANRTGAQSWPGCQRSNHRWIDTGGQNGWQTAVRRVGLHKSQRCREPCLRGSQRRYQPRKSPRHPQSGHEEPIASPDPDLFRQDRVLRNNFVSLEEVRRRLAPRVCEIGLRRLPCSKTAGTCRPSVRTSEPPPEPRALREVHWAISTKGLHPPQPRRIRSCGSTTLPS